MLATAAGYEFDVERGPDWLLIRIQAGKPVLSSPRPRSKSRNWWRKHFVYRAVLDLHGVPELTSDLIGELVELDRYILGHDGVLRVCGFRRGWSDVGDVRLRRFVPCV